MRRNHRRIEYAFEQQPPMSAIGSLVVQPLLARSGKKRTVSFQDALAA